MNRNLKINVKRKATNYDNNNGKIFTVEMKAFQNITQYFSRKVLSCSETDIDPQKQGEHHFYVLKRVDDEKLCTSEGSGSSVKHALI